MRRIRRMRRRSKNTPIKDSFRCITLLRENSIDMNCMWVILSLVLVFMSANYSNVIVVVEASRAYPEGCSNQLPSYYDYDNYPFPPPGLTRTPKDFLLLRRLGAGKFSDVFEAVDVQLEKSVVVNNNDQTNVDSRTLCVLKVRFLP